MRFQRAVSVLGLVLIAAFAGGLVGEALTAFLGRSGSTVSSATSLMIIAAQWGTYLVTAAVLFRFLFPGEFGRRSLAVRGLLMLTKEQDPI